MGLMFDRRIESTRTWYRLGRITLGLELLIRVISTSPRLQLQFDCTLLRMHASNDDAMYMTIISFRCN